MAEDSAEQSMSSSPYKCMRRWSTPRVEGMGVEKLYRESDQRKWFIKCSHCGYDQVLDYEKNIELVNEDGIDRVSKVVLPGTYRYICQKCKKSIESDRWYQGHWETTSPGSGKRIGYSISQMDAVWISPDMLKQRELTFGSKQEFYNYILGLPYSDNNNRFLPEDLTSHIGDFPMQRNRGDYSKIVVGIDWGAHYHHIVVLGIKDNHIDVIRLFRVAKSETVGTMEHDINTIIRELEPYKPDLILPDIGYSGNYVQKLQAYFGTRRVYGVRVRSAKSNQDFNAHFNQADSTVTLDKLSQNLLLMSNLRRGDIRFYKGMDSMERLFIEHGSNVVIRAEDVTDARSGEVHNELTISRRGDDHFFQAMVYANVAVKEVVNGNYGNISVTELGKFMPERTQLQQDLDIQSSEVLDF